MKKTLLVGLAIGMVSAAATIALAGPSAVQNIPAQGFSGQKNTGAAGIVNSSHDLSGTSGAGATSAGIVRNADAQSRICVYCHHPHNAYSATGATGGRTGSVAAIGSYSPLWNRELSTRSFTGYSNGTMMNPASITSTDKRHVMNGTGTKIAGVSLLCMSCHDGAVAMEAYSQVTGSSDNAGVKAGGGAITTSAGFNGDMNNHHPMGFKYSETLAGDKEIASMDTIMVPANLTAAGGPAGTTGVSIGSLLYGSNVTDATFECVTCHDVHNTANAPGAERFLWRSNNRSNFCLTCHLK